MRWPWIRDARLIEPRPVANLKVLELQTAKEILAEVFHARPGEVEEMIQRRLEESRLKEKGEDGLWPRDFCLEEGVGLMLNSYKKCHRTFGNSASYTHLNYITSRPCWEMA